MIKFRAWDKKTKVISEIKLLDFYHNVAWIEVVEDGYRLTAHRKLDDIILMQSTGLKDKNGVEIFEGDVVRYTWDMLTDLNATEKGKKVRISKVFWSDWRASWAVGRKFCNSDLFRYARNGNTVEVIGNIYQNSDLLESVEE